MIARIFAILALFAMFWVVPKYLLSPDTDSIAVTYSGAYPVMEELNFGDCYMTFEDGMMKTKGDCDSLNNANFGKPERCDITLSFLPIDRKVSRLRARFVMLKEGKEIGRGSVSIDSLIYNAENQQWSQASFRSSKCDTEELRLTEATALVDGTLTDLIASEMIRASGIIPWLPGGSTISIADGKQG